MKPQTRSAHARRWHPPERSGPAFALSLLAHGLLFIAIAFVVRWKTEPAGTVAVELWGGLPPPPVEVPREPPPVVKPPPVGAAARAAKGRYRRAEGGA